MGCPRGWGKAADPLGIGFALVTSAIIAVAKGIFRDSRVLLALRYRGRERLRARRWGEAERRAPASAPPPVGR